MTGATFLSAREEVKRKNINLIRQNHSQTRKEHLCVSYIMTVYLAPISTKTQKDATVPYDYHNLLTVTTCGRNGRNEVILSLRPV